MQVDQRAQLRRNRPGDRLGRHRDLCCSLALDGAALDQAVDYVHDEQWISFGVRMDRAREVSDVVGRPSADAVNEVIADCIRTERAKPQVAALLSRRKLPMNDGEWMIACHDSGYNVASTSRRAGSVRPRDEGHQSSVAESLQ